MVGCASGPAVTTSFNENSGQSTYQTRQYTVSTLSGANIGSSKSISMQAIGQCQGRGCKPRRVQLVFSAGGNQQLQLSGLNGKLVADNTRINWTTAEVSKNYGSGMDNTVLNVVGRFAAVNVSPNQLKQLATASSVQGDIGGVSLRIGSGVQTGLQQLHQRVTGQSTSSESSE